MSKSFGKMSVLRKALASIGVALAAGASTAAPLPDPGTGFSVQYDDFHSYSTRVLDYFFPDQGWMTSAGTGVLDVIITTRSSGQTNSGGLLAPYNIPDPITNPNTNPINDTWGGGATSSTQMLVSDLYDYLQDQFQANTPVFTFDQNETGGNPSLSVTAKVEIVDNFGAGAVLHTWAFDNSLQAGDGVYDPDALVTAPGQICIPDVLDKFPGADACFNNNVGSGQFDFIVFAPTMNLTSWVDADNVFRVTWAFSGVDDGGEEITLTGRFSPGNICIENPTAPGCQVVPEPETLALTGIGLLAAWFARRRRRQ